MRTEEAALYLGCSVSHLRRLARRGVVPHSGASNGWTFERADIEALKESGKFPGKGAAAKIPVQRPETGDQPPLPAPPIVENYVLVALERLDAGVAREAAFALLLEMPGIPDDARQLIELYWSL